MINTYYDLNYTFYILISVFMHLFFIFLHNSISTIFHSNFNIKINVQCGKCLLIIN